MRGSFIFALTILTAVIFLSSCGNVFGQYNPDQQKILSVIDPGAVEIGNSTLSPDSPLYFIKTIREAIEMKLASTTAARFDRQLEFAVRNLREIKNLVSNGHQDLIPPTIESYRYHMTEAQNMAGDNEDLQIKVTSELSRHLDVLQRFYDNTGNPLAKKAIRGSIEKNEAVNREFISKFTSAKGLQLVSNIASRQAFACKFLTREATSSALNDTERLEIKDKSQVCLEQDTKLLKGLLR